MCREGAGTELAARVTFMRRIQQVMSDAEQIADAETEQTSKVSISDEEYD